MNRVKFSYSPYNVNAMTQAAGAAAISDEAYFADVTAKVIAERTHTTDELRRRGFTVFDSATNFLFATTDRMPCVEIFEKLRARGIFNPPLQRAAHLGLSAHHDWHTRADAAVLCGTG